MRRPFILNKPIFIILLIWVLIGIGAVLRTYRGDVFPIDNNDDGLFYVWTGSSLLSNPNQVHSHTIFDSTNHALIWRSQFYDYVPHLRFGMKIVEPWFDHPPLGSIFAGLPAHLLGYTQVEQIPHMIVRYPALLASIATLFLIFVLAKQLFGTKAALFALLFAATTPYFVFAHRQAYLENFLTPIFLGSVVSYVQYSKTKNKWQLYLSLFLAGICGLIKIPAFSVPLMLAGWSLYKKDRQAYIAYGVVFTISVASYLWYGYSTNSQFFFETIANQGVRGMYLSSFIESFIRPIFYGEFMDGLYILGLIFSFVLLIKGEKTEGEKLFAWLFMSWLLVLFLVSGKYNNSPWYRYPLIPYMSIALGVYTKELLEKKSLFIVAILLLFGFSGYNLAGIELSSTLLRVATITLVAPFILLFFFPKIKFLNLLSNLTFVVLLGLIVFGNLLAIKEYPYRHCEKEPCLAPTKIVIE